ncbi:MAG: Killer protein [Rhodospirillales bacterium]|jgi:proteic killer suppression protein|nr:Killer protein [Rhodospirillales bacterium]
MPIRSWKDQATQDLFEGRFSKRFGADVARAAQRKLRMLDAATKLETLRVPPGNRLEALQGKRRGEHSIRVNDQWRVCFRWDEGDAYDVEVTDYH